MSRIGRYFIYKCIECGEDVEKSVKINHPTRCYGCVMEIARQKANKDAKEHPEKYRAYRKKQYLKNKIKTNIKRIF